MSHGPSQRSLENDIPASVPRIVAWQDVKQLNSKERNRKRRRKPSNNSALLSLSHPYVMTMWKTLSYHAFPEAFLTFMSHVCKVSLFHPDNMIQVRETATPAPCCAVTCCWLSWDWIILHYMRNVMIIGIKCNKTGYKWIYDRIIKRFKEVW